MMPAIKFAAIAVAALLSAAVPAAGLSNDAQMCLVQFVGLMAKSEQVCDAVKAYETCLTLKNLAEDDKVEAMSHVATYDCKPPVVGPEITTDEGSLLFTVDNDRSMLFHRRAAHTIDVTQLSDRVDAVEQLAAGLTAGVEKRMVEGRDILTKVTTDTIAQYTELVQGKLDKQDETISLETGKLRTTNEESRKASEDALAAAVTNFEELSDELKKDVDETNAVLKADLAELKASVGKLTKGFLGFNEATPADNCAAIKEARPQSVDGAHWIVSALDKTKAVRVWCKNINSVYTNMGGDASSKMSAATACDGNPLSLENPLSKRWVDPDATADDPSNAKLEQCETRLMIKLCTTDSDVRDWDSKFWTTQQLVNEADANEDTWAKAQNDIKAASYLTEIGETIEIVGLINGVQIGRAVYNIKSEFRKRSLQYLVTHGGPNMVIGSRDNRRSASNRPIFNRYMKKAGVAPYDMFLDTTGDLMVRQRNYGESQNSWTRLSTTDRSVTSGCHRYSGIGGDHYCGGWRLQFEAMPIVSYCYANNRYGNNHKNSKGGSTATCGSGRQTNVDFAILKNPSD